MDTKSIFKSKTMWFNGVTVIVVLATFFGYTPNQEVAAQISTFLLGAAPIVNLILRMITTKAVAVLPE